MIYNIARSLYNKVDQNEIIRRQAAVGYKVVGTYGTYL